MNVAASTIGATSTCAIGLEAVVAAGKCGLQQSFGAHAGQQPDDESGDRQHESLS